MKIKYYWFLGVAIFLSNLASAQTGSALVDPIVVPPSPEASSLTKVSNYPDATYSGIPDISIPLYEYSGNSLSYNLGLSYNAQGLKVNEEASAVGLGWILNATGVITREIRGIDDLSVKGFYKLDPASFEPGKGRDSSPDIFSFNLLGVAGKFVLNYDPSSPGNYKVVIFNQVPFKIELINSTFKVTDDSGNIYSFNSTENTKSEVLPSAGSSTTTNYISSWFLSSLKSPVGDEITFQYITNPRKVKNEYKSTHHISLADYTGACPPPNTPAIFSHTTVRTSTDQLLLNRVNFPNGYIQFQTSSRVDLDYEGSSLPLKYSKILIQSNASGFYKEIEFEHDYFSSGSGSSDKLSKRLQLQGLYEKSNTETVKTYSFAYNTLNLPDKDSPAVDYWGFYNGKTANPNLVTNREPSSAHVQANLLRSIVYPTGAKVTYTFESNNYLNFNSSLMEGESPPNSPYGGKIGPGCRIAKIEQFDHLNISLGFKEYKYFDGKRMNGSRYRQGSQDKIRVDQCIYQGIDSNGMPIYAAADVTRFYSSLMSSSNYSAAVGAGGYEIGYGQVSEIYLNQVDNGKKDYYFFNEAVITQVYPGLPRFIENKNGFLNRYVISKKNGSVYTRVEEGINSVKIVSNTTVNAKILLPKYKENGYASLDFSIVSNWKYIDTTKVMKFDTTGVLNHTKLSIYYYDNSTHKQLTKESETLSDSRKKWKFYQYPHDFSTGNATINLLKSNHILNLVVEEVSAVSSGSSYLITGGISREFKSDGKGLKDNEYHLEIVDPIPSASFKFSSRGTGSLFPSGTVGNYSKDSRFKSRLVFNTYTNNRLTMFTKNNYSVSSIKWGYGNEYPILFVANASLSNVAYTSFETGDNLNWTYSEANTSTGASKTGKKYYNLGSGAITKTGFGGSISNVFKLTFWAKRTSSGPTSWNILGSTVALSDTEWRLVQRDITTSSFTLSGSGVLIDELRFHPATSTFNTYTYLPLQGISSYTDSKNRTFYYEYDSLGRLISIKDDKGFYKESVEYEYMFSN